MSLHNSKWLLFKRKILKLLTIAVKLGHFKSFSIFGGFSSLIWRIQKKIFILQDFFQILMFHLPSLESCEVAHKIWARSVYPFWRLSNTNRRTDRQAKYIKRCPSLKLLEMSVLYKKYSKFCIIFSSHLHQAFSEVQAAEQLQQHFSEHPASQELHL